MPTNYQDLKIKKKMKNLNLVYSTNSDIDYKISNFPDGQQDITILTKPDFGLNYWSKEPVKIMSRFNSFKDLELMICATKALRRLKVKEIHLYIPYLLGARSDRKFVYGGTSYLVDVIAPIINAQGYESVTVIDVHSDVASACINNLVILTNVSLVKFVIGHIKKFEVGDTIPSVGLNKFIIVSPDAGSVKKIYNVAESIDYDKNNILTCSKYRDTDGNLTKTNVPLSVYDVNKDLVIIDDICDGGRTFINIVESIKQTRSLSSVDQPDNYGKIYLIVTHGIFSSGFDTLDEYFDGIFCTNSVKDFVVGGGNKLIQKKVF